MAGIIDEYGDYQLGWRAALYMPILESGQAIVLDYLFRVPPAISLDDAALTVRK